MPHIHTPLTDQRNCQLSLEELVHSLKLSLPEGSKATDNPAHTIHGDPNHCNHYNSLTLALSSCHHLVNSAAFAGEKKQKRDNSCVQLYM